MLQFSANLSMLFTEMPLIERFALAKQAGFNAVEIQFPYELSIEDIQTQLDTHQLQLVLINVPAGDLMQGGDGLACVPGREHQFREALLQAIQYATALHVPRVNVLAGRQPQDVELLPCLRTLAANLAFACDEFHRHGISTLFEIINGIDMPRFLIQTMAQAEEMLEAVNHPDLKIQFDCYHQAMMGEPVLLNLQQNIQYINHIQFADCPGRHEPGTGTLNLQEIFDWLKLVAYEGYVGAEYRPKTHTYESLKWLKKYLEQK